MTVSVPAAVHYFDGDELDPDDVAEPDDDAATAPPCHVLDDDLEPVCGAELAFGMSIHSGPTGRLLETPCAYGCGRPRCAQCVAVLEELGA